MYLSQLNLWNFRKYGKGEGEKPGLSLDLQPGLTLLVGENDAGKTAVIDAIKLVLLTQSREFLKLEYEDFHIPIGKTERERTDMMRIECVFKGFTDDEAKHFLEWLSIENTSDYTLSVFLIGERKEGKVFYDIKAGPDPEGMALSMIARDYLRTTYLKPLRDAESELTPGRKSRLAQILGSHEAFNAKDGTHHLSSMMQTANKGIMSYFEGFEADGTTALTDQSGKKVLEDLNKFLGRFFTERDLKKAKFSLSDPELKHILEKLLLQFEEMRTGLGSQNRLYIAAELLLLKRDIYLGLRLGLIEEAEAHLHPQAQLKLIEFLQEVADTSNVQLLLTTHSPNLASKVRLENIILCKDNNAFPLGQTHTDLSPGDYRFLQRFLDVTKANLFFAKGLILVEGDAENLLIPVIADIIGLPLSRYGISIINVNSTAFLRYSRIFKRKDISRGEMGIPISVVTDNDIKPDSTLDAAAITEKRRLKAAKYDGQGIRTFISPNWTLEYDICLSPLYKRFLQAVLMAKKVNDSETITPEDLSAITTEVDEKVAAWDAAHTTNEDRAKQIYQDLVLEKKISKAIISQVFAEDLNNEVDRPSLKVLIESSPKWDYLVEAIRYAAGIPITPPPSAEHVSDNEQ